MGSWFYSILGIKLSDWSFDRTGLVTDLLAHPRRGSTMDPGHNLPPAPTGQSSQSQGQPSQPKVQERSPFVEPEHVDRGERPQSQSVATETPLPGSSEGDRPQSQSMATEKPLLGSSEGHSPARDRSYRYPELEPPQPSPVARNNTRDEHITRGPSRRSVMGHTRSNASGIGWIVPEIEEKPHVCLARIFELASNPDPDLTATYNWRATRPNYCQCGEGKGAIRFKRLVEKFNNTSSVRYPGMGGLLVSGNLLIMFLLKHELQALR